MVSFANITARGMLNHLFLSYDSITAVDLEKNFEKMRKAWDTQKPAETLFKQIHDCVEFSEAGGITIGEAQKLTTAYNNILTTVIFNSACRRCDGKLEAENTWDNFKIHFTTSYSQHRKMNGETATDSRYANAAVPQPEEDITEPLGSFANLDSATAADHSVVATLTEANSRLSKNLEEQINHLK